VPRKRPFPNSLRLEISDPGGSRARMDERQLFPHDSLHLSDDFWPIGDLRLKGLDHGVSHIDVAVRGSTYRENSITLGIRNRTKPMVLKARKRRPRGFDSHRPLQSKTMSDGSACRPDYRHESPGMTRFMNSSNMGTVNAVSP
jgi:hypothetical protein